MDVASIAPVGKSELVDVELLSFDANNPRFTPDKAPTGDSDVAVIIELARSADLSELIQSISRSGYINIEPMIVIERDGKLVVLEGNRRLAALKVLRKSELAQQAKVSIPPLDEEVEKTLSKVLVHRVAEEKDALAIIGFKHINGPQSWDAFAKARFAARWLRQQEPGPQALSLSDIAAKMGDEHATIHRMVFALFTLEQAEETGVFSIDDRFKKSFSFSHLYTGLTYREFTDYLGLPPYERSVDPAPNPIPPSHIEKLGKLMLWLYGSKSGEIKPVVASQNPDLRRLREVLGSEVATKVIEERGSLGEAEVSAQPRSFNFEKAMLQANSSLETAMNSLEGFDPATQGYLASIAESCFKKSRNVKAGVDIALVDFEDQNGAAG